MPISFWKTFAASASLSLTIAVGSVHAFQSNEYGSSRLAITKDKNLEMVRIELYGKHPLDPHRKSLIGKYLEEIGAKTVIRTFPTAPIGNKVPPSVEGAEKLVVSVSEETWANFKEKFSGQNYLYVYFTPNQSTLYIAFDGKLGNPVYGQRMTDLRFNTPGTMMIPILLDSDEGRQVANFIKAGVNSGTNRFVYAPWLLKTGSGSTYSASSAYAACTHWFGNIPIGKKEVSAYVFPAGDRDPEGSNPLTKPLEAWQTPAGMSKEDEELLRNVWTVPGRQQLGEVLAPEANRRGEFTNPGWVAYTLLGAVGIDRVPVVFLFTRDERAPIDPKFPLQISHY